MSRLLLRRWLLLFWIATGALAAPAVRAQDDPFAGDDFFGDAAPQAADDAEPRETDPTVREIQRRAEQGTGGLVQAIRQAAQVGRFDLAGDYVAELDQRQLSGRQAAAAVEIIGGPILRRLRQSDALDDDQRQSIADLQAAAARYARDPGRMEALVEQLGAASATRRAEAVRSLAVGGRAAVRAIVGGIVSEPPAAPRETLAQVLATFGATGTEAVRQVALYGAEEARAAALDTLARIEGRRAVADLVAAAHSADGEDAAAEAARRHLTRLLGAVPGHGETTAYLERRLDEAIARWRQASPESLTGTSQGWFVSDDRASVENRPMSAAAVVARTLLDAAERVRRVSTDDRRRTLRALAAELVYRLAADEDAGFGGPDANLAARWEDRGGLAPQRIEALLVLALANDLPEAAIVAARMLEAAGDVSVLEGAGGEAAPLAAAVLDRRPRVRLEAAAAIAGLGPEQPFAGSSEVVRLWRRMAEMPNRPTAIVVDPVATNGGAIETWLSELGYHVRRVPTARALLVTAREAAELEVVVMADRLPDRGTVETVDRFRRAVGGGEVAMLVYGAAPQREPALPYGPAVARIVTPRGPEGLARAIADAVTAGGGAGITAADRLRFRESAAGILREAKTDPERFRWLDPYERAARSAPPAGGALAGSTEG